VVVINSVVVLVVAMVVVVIVVVVENRHMQDHSRAPTSPYAKLQARTPFSPFLPYNIVACGARALTSKSLQSIALVKDGICLITY
jgi:hypothetical protein